MLRGGRIAKHRGIAGGVAPRSGLVSTVLGAAATFIAVLGGFSFSVPAAFAGDCGPAPTVVCTLPAAPGDVEQSYDVTDQTLTITTENGFGLDSPNYGITVNASGTGDLRFIDEFGSTIRADGRALDLNAIGLVGEVEVKSTGSLIGAGNYGLYLAAGADISSSTLDLSRVESQTYIGMWVENMGGTLSIESSDSITGGSISGSYDGLVVSNYGTATGGVLIDVNDVSGSRNGITVSQEGMGLVSIKASGTIEGDEKGMDIDTAAGSAGGVDIDVVDVSGASDAGIDVNHQGSGDASITATGLVEGGDTGIYFEDSTAGGALEISTNNVAATGIGIQVVQNSTGAVNVASTGKITSETNSGIDITAFGPVDPADDANGEIIVNVNDIEGAYTAIRIEDQTGGDVRVTTTGTVVATAAGNTAADAIAVTKNGAAPSGDIHIDVVDVTGDFRGIQARNEGAGDIHVVATGTVTGINVAGINTQSFAGSGAVSIDVRDTQGLQAGIWADHNGEGKLEIISSGDATATGSGAGLQAGIRANAAGDGLVINANNATGEDYGVYVFGTGTGTVDVDVTGTAKATSTAGDAVYVDAGSNPAGAMDIAVNNASGGRNGIFVNNTWASTGDDDITITVTGDIQGGNAADNWGIWANAYQVFTQINVRQGATVGSGSGNAIMNVDGDSHVVVEAGAAVNGRVWLGGGDDQLDLHGGLSGTTSLDGDAGFDTLNLFDATNATREGTDIANWEVFNLDNSQLAITGGYLQVGTPGNATTGVFLTSGSLLDISSQSFFLAGNVDLAAGTTLATVGIGTGASIVDGDVANAGTISLTTAIGADAGDNLAVRNYHGDDGVIVLDTALGDDLSRTDRFRIDGDTSGSSFVRVNNVGGLGAQTVEGIKIIEVIGASDGAFLLAGDYVIEGQQAVIAGAYGYTLWKNGVTDPTDGDWYLRSQLLPPGGPTDPSDPLFQPGVPLYESYGQVLLGLNELPTLQQRVGNRYWNEAQEPVAAGDGSDPLTIEENGVWGVVEASHARLNPNLSTSGTDYDLNIWKLRAGIDRVVSEGEDGKFVAGLTGFYGHGSADISSEFGTGSIGSDTWGIGVTGTWYAASGFYLDGQAQLAWYSSDLNSDWVGNLVSDNGGIGYALSLEAGQRLGLAENWTVIPQAQLIYSNVSYNMFTDPFDATVSADGVDSLRARLGIAIEHQDSWINEAGRTERVAVHGIVNLHYEFPGGTSTDVSGTELVSENDALAGEIGVGGSYNWDDDKYSVYGQVSASSSLENLGDSYGLGGKAGLRVTW